MEFVRICLLVRVNFEKAAQVAAGKVKQVCQQHFVARRVFEGASPLPKQNIKALRVRYDCSFQKSEKKCSLIAVCFWVALELLLLLFPQSPRCCGNYNCFRNKRGAAISVLTQQKLTEPELGLLTTNEKFALLLHIPTLPSYTSLKYEIR